MSNLFRYGKLATKSRFNEERVPKRKYGDYKAAILETLKRHVELVEDPSRLVKQGKGKDPSYMMKISRVADDFSFIELTLRCGRKLFDFGQKNEKYFVYKVALNERTPETTQAIRLALLNELIEQVENDDYKPQIKAFIRRQEKEGIEKKTDGWYYS